MRHGLVLIVGALSCAALASCKSPPGQGILLAPDYGLLKPCKDDGHNGNPPSVMYQIVIPSGFDFRHPVVTKNTFPMTNGKPDTNHPLPNPVDSSNPATTRLDLVTQVVSANQTALIQIVLQDSTLDFQAGSAAVWDPKPKKNGYSNMFCGLDTTDPRAVTFTVHYPDDNGPKNVTHGHPNIGIIVKDSADPTVYSLPIFLDPDVTNDG